MSSLQLGRGREVATLVTRWLQFSAHAPGNTWLVTAAVSRPHVCRHAPCARCDTAAGRWWRGRDRFLVSHQFFSHNIRSIIGLALAVTSTQKLVNYMMRGIPASPASPASPAQPSPAPIKQIMLLKRCLCSLQRLSPVFAAWLVQVMTAELG